MLSGLWEGAQYLWFQHMHWLAWNEALLSVGPDQVWISALFNLALFLIVAAVLAGVSPIVRWRHWPAAIAFAFAWMVMFDLIALPGRLRSGGAAALAAGLAFQLARWFVMNQEAFTQWLRRSTPLMLTISLAICIGIPAWSFTAEKIETSRLPAPAPGAANVPLIVVDTVRADHLSVYGYPRSTSPNIDALAARGVLFQNACATEPWTLPSHVSMFTGQYSFQHGQSPHAPTLSRPPCAERFEGVPAAASSRIQLAPDAHRAMERHIGGYDNAICSMDEDIAAMLRKLEANGRLKNTLVIITSDHGEMLGEHGIFDHGNSLYEPVLRVPLILSMPGALPPGVRVQTPVSSVDLAASILELAKVPQRDALPGRSLAPLWGRNPEGFSASPVLAEISQADFPDTPQNWPVKRGWLRSLHDGNWKLIVHQDGRRELYDLNDDPGELKNLSGLAGPDEMSSRLFEKMAAMIPEVRAAKESQAKR